MHTMTTARGRFMLALVVLATPMWAAGQVRILQQGRALDANPYVGSGGYNAPVGQNWLSSGQLIVNRQVTGLAGFHGAVGYYPVNQLTVGLGTDTLETFQRQSVGLQDVLGGQSYVPTPYYNAARTIVDLRSIASDQAMPGRTTVRQLPPAGLYGQGGTTAYTPMTLRSPLGLTGAVLSPTEGSFLRFDVGGSMRPGRASRADLFGVSDARQSARLTRELQQVELPEDLAVPSEVDTAVDPSAAARRREQTGLPQWAEEPNAAAPPVYFAPLEAPPYTAEAQPLPANQDVFSDVLARLQGGTLRPSLTTPTPGESAWEEQDTSPPTAAEAIQARQPKLRSHPAAVGEDEDASVPMPVKDIVEYSPKGRLVLHGLAGRRRDEFNTVMAEAEEDLHAGDYYNAAEGYRHAASLQPSNPLPKLGLSLSLFAAGESFGAARQLRQAAEVFPPILTSKLDVGSMVDGEMVRRRLDFLAARLAAAGPEPSLYFIAAYLHSNLGQVDQARDYAAKLQAAIEGDVVLTNYARFVLTGQATTAPASQPTSAPAPR